MIRIHCNRVLRRVEKGMPSQIHDCCGAADKEKNVVIRNKQISIYFQQQ
jgi:hypothetical protein